MTLTSPLVSPADWTLSVVAATVPGGLRHTGGTLRGLRCTSAGGVARPVATPGGAAIRKTSAGAGEAAQMDLLPTAGLAAFGRALPFGLPVFTLIFDATGVLTYTDQADEDEFVTAGEQLGAASAVTIAVATRDRVPRDPLGWALTIRDALVAAGLDPAGWQPFLDRVQAQTGGSRAAVMISDHAGRPATGRFRLTLDAGPAGPFDVEMVEADGGDLQRTVARLNAADSVAMPIAAIWGAATAATIQPLAGPGGADFQLARLEDGARDAGQIQVTPAARHVQVTDLQRWFAPQFATPGGASPLQRYTRGNTLTPLVNGPEYFEDLFARLQEARFADGGFHLAGWAMFPTQKFVRRPGGAPEDFPRTLEEAAERIAEAGGGSRFLAAEFIQLADPNAVNAAQYLVFYALFTLAIVLKALGVDAARTDGTGLFVLVLILVLSAVIGSVVLSDDALKVEPNKDALDVLGAVAETECALSPLPASVEDNPLADLTRFPFTTLFTAIRHFGIHHQKLAVVNTPASPVGYCGGIDANPDRLDDARHLARSPYHDVHARVTGPAVRDLALTFEQRWQRDGGGAGLAFPTPALAALGAPGAVAAQVARTYHRSTAAARQFAFAPGGDRTLLDTTLRAIAEAREFIYIEDQYFTPPQEYRDALLAAVPRLKQLVVAIPGLADQPFGEVVRTGFIAALRAADPTGRVVRIGAPRRRVLLKESDLRGSSGKLILMRDLPAGAGIDPGIALGPVGRLPAPPFWVSVEGELVYVNDESTEPNPDPARMKLFRCERGDTTRLLGPGKGPTMRAHKTGAAATVADIANIYVHAKLIVVDDVFLGVGSANLNRRGFYHDSECHLFALPEAMRGDPDNPVAALRRRLWAEMLDLPAPLAGPLLDDPVAGAALFDRPYFHGNRFVDPEAAPEHVMFGVAGGDGLVTLLLQAAVLGGAAVEHTRLFDGVVDPTTRGLDPFAPA